MVQWCGVLFPAGRRGRQGTIRKPLHTGDTHGALKTSSRALQIMQRLELFDELPTSYLNVCALYSSLGLCVPSLQMSWQGSTYPSPRKWVGKMWQQRRMIWLLQVPIHLAVVRLADPISTGMRHPLMPFSLRVQWDSNPLPLVNCGDAAS